MSVDISQGGLQWNASIDLTNFDRQYRELQTRLGQLAATSNNATNQVDVFTRRAASALGTYMSLTAGKQFAGDIIRVRGEFQQLQIAFETMLQSKSKADALFKEAVSLAATTPLELKDVAGATKQLMAYGQSAEDVIDTVRMIGDVASGTGQPLQELTYLYGTLRSQGRAYAMDIRQFAGRGIPIIGELAKQFGVSAAEVNKLVEAGKVGFPQIEQAFKSLTSEGGIFNNMLEAQSKSITGQIAKLSDAWDLMLNDIGTSQEGFITDVISTLSAGIENYQTILDVIKGLVAVYGTYKAAVIATVAIQAIQNNMVKGYTVLEQLRLRAMILSEAAMRVLNKTMLLNPAVAVVTGLAAITAAFLLLRKETAGVVTAMDATAAATKRTNEAFTGKKSEVLAYVEVLKNANTSEAERLKIYNKLKEIDPAIVDGLNSKSISYDKLTANVNTYLEALRNQYRLEANQEGIKSSFEAEAVIEKRIELQDKYIEAAKRAQKAAADGQRVDLSRGFGRNGAFSAAEAIIESNKAKKVDIALLEKQKSVTTELGQAGAKLTKTNKTNQDIQARTLQVIDAEIKALKDAQEAKSTNSKEYISFEKQIAVLEKERAAIAGESKKSIKDRSSAESDLNAILQKRTSILQSIADFERDAKQSGLLKQASEIDKVNERYDEQVRLLNEANTEIEKYNRKHPNNKQDLFDQENFDQLEAARKKTVDNLQLKDDADRYIEMFQKRGEAFDRYKKIEEQGNTQLTELARQAYEDQIQNFDSYLSYLQSELAKIPESDNIKNAESRKALEKAINDEIIRMRAEATEKAIQDFSELLNAARTYNSDRAKIELKYNKLFETLELNRDKMSVGDYNDRKNALDKERKQELQDQKTHYDLQTEAYQKLMDEFLDMDKASTKARIKNIQARMALLQKESEEYKNLQRELKGLTQDKVDQNLSKFQEFAGIAEQLGGAFQQAGGKLSGIGDILVGLTSQTQNIVDLFKKINSEEGLTTGDQISSAVGAAVSLVSIVINSAAKRKAAEEAYFASVIAQQSEYNLLINEQIGLQTALEENVFVKNYQGRIADSFDQLRDAQIKYQKALEDLEKGQAKLGQRNAVDGGSVLGGAAAGAVLGAAIGSAAPVIGTIIGAVVGGVIGLIGGMKKKDVFGDLLTEYPELIKKSVNGIEELNAELAQTLIANNLVDAKTKVLLESAIAWVEQIQEARNAMKDIISELAGGLGNDLRTALVDAFKTGEDAAQKFSDSVSKTLEDMLSQLIFSKVFTGAFDNLEEEMFKSFDFGGDGSWVDDFGRFFAQAQNLTDEFNKNLEAAQQAAGQFNIDVFRRTQQNQNSGNAISGVIRGMTEQQGDLLAGQFGGLRISTIELVKNSTAQLSQLNLIVYNTAEIFKVSSILADLKLNGIRIKP